jgi:hypothetical protein
VAAALNRMTEAHVMSHYIVRRLAISLCAIMGSVGLPLRYKARSSSGLPFRLRTRVSLTMAMACLPKGVDVDINCSALYCYRSVVRLSCNLLPHLLRTEDRICSTGRLLRCLRVFNHSIKILAHLCFHRASHGSFVCSARA